MPAVDIGRFVETCFAALEADKPVEAIKDLLVVTVGQPDALIEGLPDPLGQELVLFRDPRLTIIQVTIAPGLRYPPHNHGMEAAIGLYSGLEQNLWFGGWGSDSISTMSMTELRSIHNMEMNRASMHAVAKPVQQPSTGFHDYLD